jgi:hypothetical protein
MVGVAGTRPSFYEGGAVVRALGASKVCPTSVSVGCGTANISEVVPTSSIRRVWPSSVWPTLIALTGSGIAAAGFWSAWSASPEAFVSRRWLKARHPIQRRSPHPPDGQAFPERHDIVVRRIDRPLRRRYVRHRYDRVGRADVDRRIRHAPHQAAHIIERYHLIEDGKVLEVNVHAEDPSAPISMPVVELIAIRIVEHARAGEFDAEKLTETLLAEFDV